jgi:hypothetical protein
MDSGKYRLVNTEKPLALEDELKSLKRGECNERRSIKSDSLPT